jgi:hypothetical protein
MGQEVNENNWLTPKATAKYLGVSIGQVYIDMKQYPPPYPFYRVTATRRLCKKSDLDAFLEKRKVSASSDQ